MSGPGVGRPRTVLVAGTAGGVGTTTVVALLAAALVQRGHGTPVLVDHTFGTLAARLPPDLPRSSSGELTLQDRGRHAERTAVAALANPVDTRLCLVSAASPLGVSHAERSLEALQALAGPAAAPGVHVVLVGVHGRHGLPSLRHDRLGPALVRLPGDPALAAGGPVQWDRLARRTQRHILGLADALIEPCVAATSAILSTRTRAPEPSSRQPGPAALGSGDHS
jgi:hypothetical protein